MQPKILITSLMTRVKENTKREQIEYEPIMSLTYQSTNSNHLQSGIQIKYQYPVVTNHCNHLRISYNLEQVRADLKDPNLLPFTCPAQGCGVRITSEEELVKDIRWYAIEEFHESVEEFMVIEGRLFNRYYRAKRYTEFLNDKQIRSQIIAIMHRFWEKQDSINCLILENLQSSQSKSSFRSENNQIISFLAICLQDKVKLTIPVRIFGCKHKECYEITSLLAFQKENPDEKAYHCVADGCYSKLDISNVQTMLTQLSIDLHLLNALKQSSPSSFKFIFNVNTLRIEAEVQRKDGFPIDPTIYELFKRRKAEDNQQFTIQDYLKFEKQVQSTITMILQQSVSKDIEKKLKCQKYQQAQINMQDKLTGFTVECPVRCKHTDNFEIICDLRSVIADFVYDKNKCSPIDMYKCKLCNKQHNNPYIRVQIQNQLYLDQNLISQMQNDMSYLRNKIFNYDGKSYLKQEFYDKFKYEISKFKSSLGGNMIVQFENLYCSKNKNLLLQMPLILKQCPEKNCVDFDTFYNEMTKIAFDLDSIGLILCNCEYCNKTPIKKIKGSIAYHEAFGKALSEFRQTGRKSTSFKYDFQNQRLYRKDNHKNSKSIKQISFQNAFQQKSIQGKKYQLLKMNQTIFNGLSILHDQSGIHGNLVELVDRMNNFISQSPVLRRYHFIVLSISITLRCEAIKVNIGNLKSSDWIE